MDVSLSSMKSIENSLCYNRSMSTHIIADTGGMPIQVGAFLPGGTHSFAYKKIKIFGSMGITVVERGCGGGLRAKHADYLHNSPLARQLPTSQIVHRIDEPIRVFY